MPTELFTPISISEKDGNGNFKKVIDDNFVNLARHLNDIRSWIDIAKLTIDLDDIDDGASHVKMTNAEDTKLGGIETGADVTANNEAATIASQGALATKDQVDTAEIVNNAVETAKVLDLNITLPKMVGIWKKVYDEYVTGSAVTEINISGLDGNNDQVYYIVWKVKQNVSGVRAYRLQFNGDTGNNYGRVYIGTDGTNPIVGKFTGINHWTLMNTRANGQTAQCYMTVDAKTGSARIGNIITADSITGTTVQRWWGFGQVWNNTGSNIISMKFYIDAASGIAIGSHLLVYKIPLYP